MASNNGVKDVLVFGDVHERLLDEAMKIDADSVKRKLDALGRKTLYGRDELNKLVVDVANGRGPTGVYALQTEIESIASALQRCKKYEILKANAKAYRDSVVNGFRPQVYLLEGDDESHKSLMDRGCNVVSLDEGLDEYYRLEEMRSEGMVGTPDWNKDQTSREQKWGKKTLEVVPKHDVSYVGVGRTHLEPNAVGYGRLEDVLRKGKEYVPNGAALNFIFLRPNAAVPLADIEGLEREISTYNMSTSFG